MVKYCEGLLEKLTTFYNKQWREEMGGLVRDDRLNTCSYNRCVRALDEFLQLAGKNKDMEEEKKK